MRLIFVIILLKRRCWSFSLKSYYINVRLLSERWTLQPSKTKKLSKQKRKGRFLVVIKKDGWLSLFYAFSKRTSRTFHRVDSPRRLSQISREFTQNCKLKRVNYLLDDLMSTRVLDDQIHLQKYWILIERQYLFKRYNYKVRISLVLQSGTRVLHVLVMYVQVLKYEYSEYQSDLKSLLIKLNFIEFQRG